MKKMIFKLIPGLLMALVFTLAGTDLYAQKKGTETIEIKTSAVCEMCKATIEKAMAYERGVKSADLDVETKILTVVYKTKKTNPDKIRKAVTLSGYDADDMPADATAYENLHACCKKDAH